MHAYINTDICIYIMGADTMTTDEDDANALPQMMGFIDAFVLEKINRSSDML